METPIKIVWNDPTYRTVHEFASADEAETWLMDVLEDRIGAYSDADGNDPLMVWLAEQGYQADGLTLLAYEHDEGEHDEFQVFVNGHESDPYELIKMLEEGR